MSSLLSTFVAVCLFSVLAAPPAFGQEAGPCPEENITIREFVQMALDQKILGPPAAEAGLDALSGDDVWALRNGSTEDEAACERLNLFEPPDPFGSSRFEGAYHRAGDFYFVHYYAVDPADTLPYAPFLVLSEEFEILIYTL